MVDRFGDRLSLINIHFESNRIDILSNSSIHEKSEKKFNFVFHDFFFLSHYLYVCVCVWFNSNIYMNSCVPKAYNTNIIMLYKLIQTNSSNNSNINRFTAWADIWFFNNKKKNFFFFIFIFIMENCLEKKPQTFSSCLMLRKLLLLSLLLLLLETDKWLLSSFFSLWLSLHLWKQLKL